MFQVICWDEIYSKPAEGEPISSFSELSEAIKAANELSSSFCEDETPHYSEAPEGIFYAGNKVVAKSTNQSDFSALIWQKVG